MDDYSKILDYNFTVFNSKINYDIRKSVEAGKISQLIHREVIIFYF